MRKVVYLSGRIADLTYEEATKRRNRLRKLLEERGWQVLDPMEGKEILSSVKKIKEEEACELLGVEDSAIIQRDLQDIHAASVILICSGNDPSWGTGMEWGFSAIALQKPVVVIGLKHRDHPWCSHFASYFAKTEREAVAFMEEWFHYEEDK